MNMIKKMVLGLIIACTGAFFGVQASEATDVLTVDAKKLAALREKARQVETVEQLQAILTEAGPEGAREILTIPVKRGIRTQTNHFLLPRLVSNCKARADLIDYVVAEGGMETAVTNDGGSIESVLSSVVFDSATEGSLCRSDWPIDMVREKIKRLVHVGIPLTVLNKSLYSSVEGATFADRAKNNLFIWKKARIKMPVLCAVKTTHEAGMERLKKIGRIRNLLYTSLPPKLSLDVVKLCADYILYYDGEVQELEKLKALLDEPCLQRSLEQLASIPLVPDAAPTPSQLLPYLF